MEHGTTFIILAGIFGFFMAWGIGANDVANAIGTSVGSRTLSIKQAIVVATIFECAGALLVGGQVTDTLRAKIVDPSLFIAHPELFIYGMLAALLAAGIWLMVASIFAWPVSTTHTIVGAIIGFALLNFGPNTIHWHEVINIIASWIITPIIAGIISYGLIISIQRLILDADDPFGAAQRYVPLYTLYMALVVGLVTLLRGLKHLKIHLDFLHGTLLTILFGILIYYISVMLVRRVKRERSLERDFHFANVEKLFGVLMIFAAAAMAFAHGSNDVANAIGPLAAIISIAENGGVIAAKMPVPPWVLLLGAFGIVVGLATYGYKVIATVGENITQLTPSRGFAAQLATATTVIMASGTGLPVSTTQTLVGAILGVGLARGIGALNLYVIRNIFMSWVITLPAGALLASIVFLALKAIF